jgi:hypothetical protein
VRNLDYKTVRYPGHRDLMKLLLEDLQLKHDQETLKDIMRKSMPCTMQDVVLVFVTVSGMRDGQLLQEVFARKIFADRGERTRCRPSRSPPPPASAPRWTCSAKASCRSGLHPAGAGGAAGLPGQPLRQGLPAVAPGGIDRLMNRWTVEPCLLPWPARFRTPMP